MVWGHTPQYSRRLYWDYTNTNGQARRTFGELPHALHVGRQVLSHQGDQRVVVLQLVDQVVPIEHMRTPLSLTVRGWREGEGGRERGMEGGTRKERDYGRTRE